MVDNSPWLSSVNTYNIALFFIYDFSYDLFVGTLTVLFFLRSVSSQSFKIALVGGLTLATLTASLTTAGSNYVSVSPNTGRGFEFRMQLAACTIHILILFILASVKSRRTSSNLFVMHQISWRLASVGFSCCCLLCACVCVCMCVCASAHASVAKKLLDKGTHHPQPNLLS